MCERVCFGLEKVLKYDDEVKLFVAFIKGNEKREIMYADGKQIEINCAPDTDALFVISCKTAGICYAETLVFSVEGTANIISLLDDWGIDRSVEWTEDSVCFNEADYGDFDLYDHGFRVRFGDKEYVDGIINE